MDASRLFSYLAGLLNRMAIRANAASPFIRETKENRKAWATLHNSGAA